MPGKHNAGGCGSCDRCCSNLTDGMVLKLTGGPFGPTNFILSKTGSSPDVWQTLTTQTFQCDPTETLTISATVTCASGHDYRLQLTITADTSCNATVDETITAAAVCTCSTSSPLVTYSTFNLASCDHCSTSAVTPALYCTAACSVNCCDQCGPVWPSLSNTPTSITAKIINASGLTDQSLCTATPACASLNNESAVCDQVTFPTPNYCLYHKSITSYLYACGFTQGFWSVEFVKSGSDNIIRGIFTLGSATFPPSVTWEKNYGSEPIPCTQLEDVDLTFVSTGGTPNNMTAWCNGSNWSGTNLRLNPT